jgi:outer membrane protein assembly factor BamD
MFHQRPSWRRHAVPFVALAVLSAGCGARQELVPPGAVDADRVLYERGQEAVKERRWADARDYFTRVIDGYPQSQYRADAKLGMGDVYLEQGSAESLVLAQAEFRDFLAYFPTSPKADYAQYRLAMTHFEGMRAPERDQTETRAAVSELTRFVERYPDSELIDEARTRLREARDRLSESSFRVGLHYFRTGWFPGAVPRFLELLEEDPGYRRRDEIYYYLAESFRRAENKTEALSYYERLVAEFESSEYLQEARERIAELGQERED